ncbi:hypothetical protein CLU79DRAFT_680166, partial [Phycomyces nitens]
NELLQFIWSYKCPDKTDENEQSLIRTMQFVLTDFCSKCNRKSSVITLANSERTFWVDRIVPLFQSFGDQTGLLTYQW